MRIKALANEVGGIHACMGVSLAEGRERQRKILVFVPSQNE